MNSNKIIPVSECDICYEELKSDFVKTCGNKACNFKVCKTCGIQHVRIKEANTCPACQQKIRHNTFVVNQRNTTVEGQVVNQKCCQKIRDACYIYWNSEPACCIKTEPGRSAGITRYTCCFGYCVTEQTDCLITCIEDYCVGLCCTATSIGCCFAIKGLGFWLLAKGAVGNATTRRVFLARSAPMCIGEFIVGIFGLSGIIISGIIAGSLGKCFYDAGKIITKKAINRTQKCLQVSSQCMNRYWEGMTT